MFGYGVGSSIVVGIVESYIGCKECLKVIIQFSWQIMPKTSHVSLELTNSPNSTREGGC